MKIDRLETSLQASTILRAREMSATGQDTSSGQTSGEHISGDDLTFLANSRSLPVTADTMELERREVLEAILTDMRRHDSSTGWDVNRRLLEHLATPLTPLYKRGISKLIH